MEEADTVDVEVSVEQNTLLQSQQLQLQSGARRRRTEDVTRGVPSDANFSSLLLSEPVLRGLKSMGYDRPSPVQMKAIPPAILGFGDLSFFLLPCVCICSIFLIFHIWNACTFRY